MVKNKMKKSKNFERELPRGYKEAFRLNARKKETIISLSIVSFIVTAVVFVLLLIPIFKSGIDLSGVNAFEFFIFYGVFIVANLLYVALHELTHGAVYKLMTGEKLTFGITSATAFCGVPNIYTYRRCALTATLAPFVTYTFVIGVIVLFLSVLDPLYYIGFSFIFALHLGGCVGDLYLSYVLITRFKDKDTLMKDTGPEQIIYKKKK